MSKMSFWAVTTFDLFYITSTSLLDILVQIPSKNNSVEGKKQTLEKHYITLYYFALHIALLDSFIGINTSPVLYTPR